MKNKIMPYSQARKLMTNFSVINCQHKEWPWKLIGHTAGIKTIEGSVFVLESTTQNKLSGRQGVQIHPMSSWLKQYNGKAWLRTFEYENNPRHWYRDKEFYNLIKDRSYPDTKDISGLWKLICAAVDIRIGGRDLITYEGDDKGIFCTQLQMARLAFCGFSKIVKPVQLTTALEYAKEFQPDDLRKNNLSNILQDCKLKREIRIK